MRIGIEQFSMRAKRSACSRLPLSLHRWAAQQCDLLSRFGPLPIRSECVYINHSPRRHCEVEQISRVDAKWADLNEAASSGCRGLPDGERAISDNGGSGNKLYEMVFPTAVALITMAIGRVRAAARNCVHDLDLATGQDLAIAI